MFCPAGLEREKLLATAAYGATIYEVLGSYDDCSRLTVELSFELPWAFVNVGLRAYYAEGSKTLAFEVAEQLGWRLPDAVVCPVASGALFSKIGRGFGEFIELGLVDGAPPRLIGAQAQGCDPVAAAYREERPVTPIRPQTTASSLAIGNPADGDHALATARASGGSIHSVPEDEIGSNMVLLAETSGVFGEAAAGICLGALREAIAQGTRHRGRPRRPPRHRRRPEDARPGGRPVRRDRDRGGRRRAARPARSRRLRTVPNFTFYTANGTLDERCITPLPRVQHPARGGGSSSRSCRRPERP